MAIFIFILKIMTDWHKMVEIGRKTVTIMILKDVSVLYEIGIFNGRYDEENANHHFILGIESVMDVINDLPTVEAKEIEYGKWVEFDLAGTSCQCTNCGFVVKCKPKENNMNYCPDCGATMRKKVV